MAGPSGPHVDPSEQQLADIVAAAGSNDGPIVMVNLLKFREAGGLESYLRYGTEIQPHLERVGARLLYAGSAAQVFVGDADADGWDAVVLVRYPSRSALLDMVLDPGYQEIAVHRVDALVTSALIVTDPW